MAFHGPPNTCPKCGKMIDGHTSLSDESAVPGPGNLTICAYCGALMEYGEGLSLRLMTDLELAQLPLDDQRRIFETRHAVALARQRRGR